MFQVGVSEESCITSGQCNFIAPHVFDQDDDGMVVLLVNEIGQEDLDAVREAARVCPGRAISVGSSQQQGD